MLLLIIILSVNANPCDERTSYYISGWNVNKNYHYFDPTTYFRSNQPMTVQDYKNKISLTPCTGEWCNYGNNGKWGCNKGDSKNCYNVEHIIPKANSLKELKGCSLDIEGNLVMSYGAWNQALKNEYYGEKTAIYGNTLMKAAYQSVYEACHKVQSLSYPDALCLNKSIVLIAVIIFIVVLSALFIIIYIIYIKRERIDI